MPNVIKTNLAAIIQRCQQQKVQVLMLSMALPPNYGKRYTKMFENIFPQLAKELNIAIIPFIFNKIVVSPELIQADGLHPNAKAQPLILAKIFTYLTQILSLK
jgi:acyl-CoA thioesterase-1